MEFKKYEIVGSGTVEMLEPLIKNFVSERREWLDDDFFRKSTSTYLFRGYGWHVDTNDGREGHEFGTIEIQQLPHGRVLITFGYRSKRDLLATTLPDPIQEDYDHFDSFVNDLFTRLVQLGFIELPEQPKLKPSIGFKSS